MAEGAHFEISIDGKPRSYRDDPQIALEAAKYLKFKHPIGIAFDVPIIAEASRRDAACAGEASHVVSRSAT